MLGPRDTFCPRRLLAGREGAGDDDERLDVILGVDALLGDRGVGCGARESDDGEGVDGVRRDDRGCERGRDAELVDG